MSKTSLPSYALARGASEQWTRKKKTHEGKLTEGDEDLDTNLNR